MPELERSETLSESLAFQLDLQNSTSLPRKVLAFLAFDGFAVRVGLELSFCIVLFTVCTNVIPAGALPVPIQWHALVLWFSSCGFVAVVDQFLLARPANTLRRVWQLDLVGAYERALIQLDSIGPSSKSFIRYPAASYHLTRGRVLLHAEQFADAARQFQFAERAGVEPQALALARTELFTAQGDLEGARGELALAKLQCGDCAIMKLEEGRILLQDRNSLREAKRILTEVQSMKPALHPDGDSTSLIAQAYSGVAQLWTGEAEEGLLALGDCISKLQTTASYLESIRPTLAQLYMERSYYLATHREPEGAVEDLKAGLALCSYPQVRARASDVKDEIRLRYPTT